MKVMAILSALVLLAAGSTRADESQIVLVGRFNSSGEYELVRERVLGKEGRFRKEIAAQSGEEDVVELVAKTPAAIGYGRLGKDDRVKVLKISVDGEKAVSPTPRNVKTGKYPLAWPLRIYTAKPTGTLKHYLNWLQGREARKITKREGYIPVGSPHADDDESPPGTLNISGSDMMVQLGGAWATAYQKRFPNVVISVRGGGTGIGILNLMDGKTDIAHATREMRERERTKANAMSLDIEEHTVAYQVIYVYVHKENPIDEISLEQLRAIYGDGGSIRSWSQLEGKN